jgi:MFS family permease
MPRLIPGTGPQRAFTASTFANSIGSGIYLTAGVLYFTEAVHLPAAQVGLGLGIAGLVALGVGIAVGHLADRWGPRGVYSATLLVRALATAGFTLASSSGRTSW